MSFYTSLSGLQASQTDMSTITHNLANVATNRLQEEPHRIRRRHRVERATDPRKMVGSGVVVQGNRSSSGGQPPDDVERARSGAGWRRLLHR